jgi:phage gp29-like protein
MPRKKLPPELKQEIASVERDINYTVYGGVLQNPDETLLKRGSGKGLKLYDEIEEDAHAYAVLQKRKLAVISRPWEIKAGGTSRKDRLAAELVEKQLEKKLDQLSCDLLDATLKGFAVSEPMWEDTGDEILVKKFLARDQRRFTFAPDNSLRLLTLQNMVTGEAVPARKFIRHSFGAKDGNPFGRGLGSKLYFPVWFKRQGISFWLVFCEKFGMPTAVGKYPNGSTQAEINKLKEALRSVAQDAGVVIPEGMLIELLEASRSSTSDLYERIVRYMDEQMSECVLGETLTTNIGSVGSKAAADTHNGVRLEITKADADLLSATLNETYCVWVTELNIPGANPPTVWRIFEEQEDLDKRSDRDKKLFDMGYRLTPKKVEEVYGEGYELIEDAQQAGAVSDDEFLKNSGASTDSTPTDQESDQSPPDNQDAGNQDNQADNSTGFAEDEPQGISDEDFINNSLYHEDSALFAELQEVFKQDAKSLFAEFSEDAEGDLIQQVLDWSESLEKLPYDLYENLTAEFAMNNLDVATLTLIGKRVCQLVSDVEFAESKIRVTDSEDLLEMKSIIESTYLDGITAIPEAYYNSDNGEFVGIFEDKLSPQVTKRYKFSFTAEDIAYKLVNPGDLVNFSEESLDYAAKGKNCTKGTQCGESCISATKQCRKNLPPGAKNTAVKLEKKLKENNKPTSKATQPKPEKGQTTAPLASKPDNKSVEPPLLDETDLLADLFDTNPQPKLQKTGGHDYISEPETSLIGKIPIGDRMKQLEAVTGLSDQELKPLVQSIIDFSEENYASIRKADRGEATIEVFKNDADNINLLLDKLPAYNDVIYRGVPLMDRNGRSLLDKLANDEYVLDAMSSFSSNLTIAEDFALGLGGTTDADYSGGGVILVIKKNSRGKSIKHLSANPQEDEVLVPKGTRYRFTSNPPKIKYGDGSYGENFIQVEIEEV